MARINLDEAIRQVQQAAAEQEAGIGQATRELFNGLIDNDGWDAVADRLGDQFQAAVNAACDAGASINLLRGLLGLERK